MYCSRCSSYQCECEDYPIEIEIRDLRNSIQSLEQEVARLKEENLRMRNCENCFHYSLIDDCNLNSISCIKFDKWELGK